MSSVNFNAAATSALRVLQTTNSQLDATQNRISTGFKIGEAKDNAAYWSISTAMKSDNKTMETVSDALGLGAATVDTAYQGLNAAKDVLDEIKSKIVAATQDGVDKAAVQSEIAALQEQLRSIANSSVFSGENLLAANTTTKPAATVVSSYTRSGTSVSIGTIDIQINTVALTDAGAADGILETSQTGSMTGYMSAAQAGITTARTITDEVFSFTAQVGNGGSVNVSLSAATVRTALNIAAGSDAVVSTNAAMVKVINQALADAKVTGLSAQVIPAGETNAGQIRYVSDKAFTLGAASKTSGAGGTAVGDIGLIGSNTTVSNTSIGNVAATVFSLDVRSKTTAELKGMSEIVNKVLKSVTDGASQLGAISKRIELQKTFVSNLMDTIDKGVSGLVDADMNEESTKLQALQVKQQLGVQALSIANQSAQNVLRLFQ